jgi:hypothetical protein
MYFRTEDFLDISFNGEMLLRTEGWRGVACFTGEIDFLTDAIFTG